MTTSSTNYTTFCKGAQLHFPAGLSHSLTLKVPIVLVFPGFYHARRREIVRFPFFIKQKQGSKEPCSHAQLILGIERAVVPASSNLQSSKRGTQCFAAPTSASPAAPW